MMMRHEERCHSSCCLSFWGCFGDIVRASLSHINFQGLRCSTNSVITWNNRLDKQAVRQDKQG